jgi:hypothetical protein
MPLPGFRTIRFFMIKQSGHCEEKKIQRSTTQINEQDRLKNIQIKFQVVHYEYIMKMTVFGLWNVMWLQNPAWPWKS